MYDARQIANWFVERARRDSRTFSIMQLLKLVYIAHGWHLEMRNAPLITNKIEAWKFGPVIPDVYHAFRSQGVDISTSTRLPDSPEILPQDVHLLEQIYGSYGSLPAMTLSDMTHEQNGPWDISSRTFGYFAPIGNDVIRQHYIEKRKQFNQAASNG
jgi:uncharacterized phage-associated protein